MFLVTKGGIGEKASSRSCLPWTMRFNSGWEGKTVVVRGRFRCDYGEGVSPKSSKLLAQPAAHVRALHTREEWYPESVHEPAAFSVASRRTWRSQRACVLAVRGSGE